MDGAHGLVLAAETAVGKFPVESAAMVVRMIRAFEQAGRRLLEDDLLLPGSELRSPERLSQEV
jgi:pyruvate kinase